MTEPGKGAHPDTYTLSSGEAAKAELRELREELDRWREVVELVKRDLERIADCHGTDRVDADWMQETAAYALARYEALRDGRSLRQWRICAAPSPTTQRDG